MAKSSTWKERAKNVSTKLATLERRSKTDLTHVDTFNTGKGISSRRSLFGLQGRQTVLMLGRGRVGRHEAALHPNQLVLRLLRRRHQSVDVVFFTAKVHDGTRHTSDGIVNATRRK